MDLITFEYNGKQITTPNLEKKLKRMKLSLNDIKIVPTPQIIKSEELGLNNPDKEQVIIRSIQDDIRRVCYVTKGTRPPLEDLFKNQIWNHETKTGVYPKLFIKTFYYE